MVAATARSAGFFEIVEGNTLRWNQWCFQAAELCGGFRNTMLMLLFMPAKSPLRKIFPKNQKKVLTNPRMCDRMLLQRNELIFISRITNICSVMARQNQNGGRFYGQEGLSGELSGMRAVAVQGQP